MKIGYQGIEGSNSEAAALEFVKRNSLDATLVPLIDSYHVKEELLNKTIEYGVMAFQNKITGIVLETKEALETVNYVIIDTIKLPISHAFFIHKDASIKDIKKICSHIQALNQTKEYRKEYYPNLIEIPYNDTALAAYDLSTSKLPKDTMIIARKNAGISYGLTLVEDNISDCKENSTLFHLIRIL